MGYIYKADTYCDKCGEDIRKRLRENNEAPEDVMDHSSYDSDDFPKDADIENEESDKPEHCAHCGEFMHNPLTSEGYNYVQSALNEHTRNGKITMNAWLLRWGRWYGFRYWDAEDCTDGLDETRVPGWYSDEAF